MPGVTIIQKSQVDQFGRWDVAFHEAISATAKRVAEIKRQMPTPEALKEFTDLIITKLTALDPRELAPIAPLTRGSMPKNERFAPYLHRAIREYPLEAYALLELERPKMEARLEAEIEEKREYLNRVRGL